MAKGSKISERTDRLMLVTVTSGSGRLLPRVGWLIYSLILVTVEWGSDSLPHSDKLSGRYEVTDNLILVKLVGELTHFPTLIT